jgi:hypothetical protein
MPLLRSARFRGEPTLERIRAQDTSAYLRFGAQGEHVRAVQFALIDLGYSIPDGATGLFANQTSAAVVDFKTDAHLVPNDPVVGVGTITALDDAFARPFADRDEWLSWNTRPFPQFNHSRVAELARRDNGWRFSFNPLSSFVPGAIRDALVVGLTDILDPDGSPAGPFTPSASWGASPLDMYHCHLSVDIAHLADPTWSEWRNLAEKIHNRILQMLGQTDQAGPEGTPPWTAAYRELLLAPGQPGSPGFIDMWRTLLEGIVANSVARQQTLRMVWHTFEEPIWRPVDMGSTDPRRGWWNDVSPVPSGVTRTPFPINAFGDNVMELTEIAFLVDQDFVITVLGTTRTEVGALVHLDKADLDAVTAPP